MSDVNEKLRQVARAGSESELEALLRDPGFDALSRDKYGMTALMHASYNGKDGGVRLLLPASDVLAKDKDGLTASTWARKQGHESLSQFIDAYVLSQTERAAIESTSSPLSPRGRAKPRV